MSRGSPGPGNRAKRVPPVPRPQDGTATRKRIARSVNASMSMSSTQSYRQQRVRLPMVDAARAVL